jgi:hypothetical protein
MLHLTASYSTRPSYLQGTMPLDVPKRYGPKDGLAALYCSNIIHNACSLFSPFLPWTLNWCLATLLVTKYDIHRPMYYLLIKQHFLYSYFTLITYSIMITSAICLMYKLFAKESDLFSKILLIHPKLHLCHLSTALPTLQCSTLLQYPPRCGQAICRGNTMPMDVPKGEVRI